MYFDTLFDGLRMDMIALESAINTYEIENDITPSYLNSDESYDVIEAASEAANSFSDESENDNDFAFGFGLFEDKIALESEGADSSSDEKKASFGSRLGAAIKSIFGAIAKFFKSAIEKVKGLAAKISQKRAEAKAKKNPPPPTLKEVVLSEAKAVRSNYQKAISMLDESVRSDAILINNICKKINEAIAKANSAPTGTDDKSHGATINGTSKGSVSKKNLEKMGAAFNEVDGTSKEIEDAESALERCKSVNENLQKAMDLIAASYASFIGKVTQLKVGTRHSAADELAADRNRNSRLADSKSKNKNPQKDASDYSKEIQESDKADIKAGNQMVSDWNKEHKKDEGAKLSSKDKGTTAVTIEMAKAIIMYEEYTGSTSIPKLIGALNNVTKTCETNISFCEAVSTKIKEDTMDTPNTKRAYRLCKIYHNASNTFTELLVIASSLSSGTCFKPGGDRQISDNLHMDSGRNINISNPDEIKKKK